MTSTIGYVSDAFLYDAQFLIAGTDVFYEILSVKVEVISDATVGNRQIVIIVRDSSGQAVFKFNAGAVQTASLTCDYICGRGVTPTNVFNNGGLFIQLPLGLVLLPSWSMEVADDNGIGTDDIWVQAIYREMDYNNGDLIS